jgi:hypothetical protein
MAAQSILSKQWSVSSRSATDRGFSWLKITFYFFAFTFVLLLLNPEVGSGLWA